jgi:N-acetylglutamate synthase-like GNAT family acetyltransferase
LVDPAACGLGIGARLVEECVRFARQAGYRELVLWTTTCSKPHTNFGRRQVDQDWRLRLSPAA